MSIFEHKQSQNKAPILLLLVLSLLLSYWSIKKFNCRIDNCAFCSFNGYLCQSCAKGYFLNQNQKKCSQCNKTIEGCELCQRLSTDLTCLKCEEGLFPTSDYRRCMQCGNLVDSCKRCSLDGSQLCQECEQGYVLSKGQQSCIRLWTFQRVLILILKIALVLVVIFAVVVFAIVMCMKEMLQDFMKSLQKKFEKTNLIENLIEAIINGLKENWNKNIGNAPTNNNSQISKKMR